MWYTYEYKNYPYWKSYVYKLGITPYNSWFLNSNMARLSQNQRLLAVGKVEAGLHQYDIAARFGVQRATISDFLLVTDCMGL